MHIRKLVLALLLGAVACDESPVSLPEAAGVTVATGAMALVVGDEAPLAAQVVDQGGQVMQGQAVVYSTDNASVATVGANGMVRAVAPGTANVTAAYGSNTATVKVTVEPDRRNEVQSLNVLADSVVADRRGGVQVVSVRATDGLGQAVCPVLSLRSSDPSVVMVQGVGPCRIEVTPLFPGETTITVEAEGRTDTFRVRVTSSGQVAFFSQRPAAEQVVAGGTVGYTIKVLDQANRPVANQAVNLDVSAGGLSASRVTTDATGTVTVEWTLPTNLRDWGQNQTISFRTLLPNGTVGSGTESVFVNGASLAEIVLYRRNGSTFTRVDATSLSVPAYTTVYLGASGLDQYGNVRITDFTFSLTASAAWLDCGTDGVRDPSGIEYSCVWGYPTSSYGPATFRAMASGGMEKSVQVTFN
jgi:hypothetical protein